MSILGKNYRKAKPGETRCPNCVFFQKPWFPNERGRCKTPFTLHGPQWDFAVGKKNTCDSAARKEVE